MKIDDLIKALRESNDYVEETKLARFGGVVFSCDKGLIKVEDDGGVYFNDVYCPKPIIECMAWSPTYLLSVGFDIEYFMAVSK